MTAAPTNKTALEAWLPFASVLVAAVAVITGIIMFIGIFPEDGAVVGSVIYAFTSGGAGLLILIAALRLRGRARNAWSLIGLGVLCWGIGETVWTTQSLTSVEIPYPGPADIFYVLGYPLILLGVIVLPYLRPGRFERLRLTIDAAAGALSLVVVMWVVYLEQVVSLGGEQKPLEMALNLFYPVGDVLLATALMILAMRRSEQRLDRRIVLLAVGVALTTAADVTFSLQVAAGTYVAWAWLDGVWLFSYAAFALAGWAIIRPAKGTEAVYRSVGGWQLFAPYAAVAALFGVRFLTSTGADLLLNVATTVVATLIVLRQGIAIRERRELLERQRDDLVASVSHELRTPLTSIQGFAQLLHDSWASFSEDDRRSMVATISDEAAHLGRIVSDLIDVARDRLQNVKLDISRESVADLARDAADMAGGDRRAGLDLIEDTFVEADADRIRQVLVNLITNAQRYGRSRVEVVTEMRDGMVCFSVHDDGDGVPLKHQTDIFERFERGAHRLDSSVPGSGIGLSVARDLITAHGSTITYRQSERLGGACFEFILPAVAEQSGLLSVVGSGDMSSG
jgi:signal transduction histidine kinase